MARKRTARGRGSVYQRTDGLWVGSLSAGYEMGRRRRLVVYGKSAEDVSADLEVLKKRLARGDIPAAKRRGERANLEELLTAWLDRSIKPRRKATTYVDHKNTVEKHIVPLIGSDDVRRIEPARIARLYAELERRDIGARTRQKVHIVLGAAFRWAVRNDIVPRSPMDRVDAPAYRAATFQPYDAKEARAFLKAIEGDPLEALYLLAIFTGMRLGELFGLQREDVDLKARAIYVQRSLQNIAGKRELVSAKTESSRRRIELPQICVTALRAHLKTRASKGPATAFVFCDRKGNGISRTAFRTRQWLPLLEAKKLRPIRFHDLRHTMATLMLAAGEHPKLVSERLGHSRIATTMDIYSHVLPGLQRQAVTRLEKTLKRK